MDPRDWRQWHPSIRGAQRLAAVLFEHWNKAVLYRTLATLRLEAPVSRTIDELQWRGPAAGFEGYCGRLQFGGLHERASTALQTRYARAAAAL